MVLFYKLPNQWPRLIPRDVTCTIDALKQYIKAEHRITSPFKLRVCVGGKVRFLKPTQRLVVVTAMGAEVISMNYRDLPSQRRKLAKETAAFALETTSGDGLGRKRPARDAAAALRASVRKSVEQASAEALRACEEMLQVQAYAHDDGVADPERRRLEARDVRITGERALAGPTTAPYMSAIKAEQQATPDGPP